MGGGGTDVVDVEEEEGGGEGAALGNAVGDGFVGGFGVCCVEGLLAVGEVGLEEGQGVWMEIEVVFEFVEEFSVRNSVICFGEVEEDGQGGEFFSFVADDFVDDGG